MWPLSVCQVQSSFWFNWFSFLFPQAKHFTPPRANIFSDELGSSSSGSYGAHLKFYSNISILKLKSSFESNDEKECILLFCRKWRWFINARRKHLNQTLELPASKVAERPPGSSSQVIAADWNDFASLRSRGLRSAKFARCRKLFSFVLQNHLWYDIHTVITDYYVELDHRCGNFYRWKLCFIGGDWSCRSYSVLLNDYLW